MAAPQSRNIVLNGAELLALSAGGLYWPEKNTLIVSDLHFEKGTSYAATGQFLPPYDSRATLTRLAELMDQLKPNRVLCLGDSFHDSAAADRMDLQDKDLLGRLTKMTEWIWVAGNHDPHPPKDMGGSVCSDHTEGPLVFRHEADINQGAGEISGHYHPKAKIQTRARRVGAPCFVEDGHRMILPAFGAFTGGLNVSDTAISRFFPRGFTAHLATRHGIVSVPRNRLLDVA